ncbi:hypothetical protein NKR23_g5087 [Pleurostoma richardsiae]|uniref:C2H2-type domain-containing protein n=1 Tax=Pleurostoma richardsiae TaxID=41990 RepID=A0AA38S390_9PEZI|nr:hypothetical protein NKR23_g5087 [Pleurostoma richardsiae]
MASSTALLKCPSCVETFTTERELREHKSRMVYELFFESNDVLEIPQDGQIDHLYCDKCDVDFRHFRAYMRHLHERHPEKQNLICPGCLQKFHRAGGLIAHIEQDSCQTIRGSDITQRREEKVERMIRKLEPLRKAGEYLGIPKPNPDYAATYLSSHKDPLAGTSRSASWIPKPDAEQEWGPAAQALGPEAQFPRMPHREYLDGYTKVPDLLTGDEDSPMEMKPGNSWASSENAQKLFPNAPQQTLDDLHRDPTKPPAETQEVPNPHDPSAPGFNPNTYFSPYTKKYMCPHLNCYKKFNQGNALVGHLNSAAHCGTRVQCPQCLKYFGSTTALVQHTESNGVRCHMKHQDDYRDFLEQLTGGLTDTGGMHRDDTVRYVVTDDAIETFGPANGLVTFRQRSQAAAEKVVNDAVEWKKNYWKTRADKIQW